MNLEAISHTFSTTPDVNITLETGKMARQADGSVLLKQGNTMILATVVATHEAKEGQNFFPLSVEYREKFAAAGRIPGSFLRREARPSDNEILISRLIDRALRPLFPEDYFCEVQIIVTLVSADANTQPDALACLAASAALMVSDIPFSGPVSEVRIGKVNGQMIINPTTAQLKESTIDMIVAATDKNIMMVEGEMKEISEAEMVEAIALAHDAIRIQCNAQIELASKVEKAAVKREIAPQPQDEELLAKMKSEVYPKIYNLISQTIKDKKIRRESIGAIKDEFVAQFTEEELEEKGSFISKYFSDLEWEASRRLVLDDRKRLDGRATDEIRPIWIETDYLPSAHGSALFTRGETQSLTTVTLGTKMDEQLIDQPLLQDTERFMLHYNFPPFCTGEVKRMTGLSRREVGHGNLAWRALKNAVKGLKDNAYTIRIVSDILESNGSSSMATVCAGSLSLMDSGIPIPEHISGIAMGLITDDTGKYAILSDILGDEDHLGDMDFKVCGTSKGITACQMDIKIDGLSKEILTEALEQARKGRLHILSKMNEAIPAPRADYKPFVPRIVKLVIPQEFIGAVIGPGGKVIQEIQKTTGTTISIEEVDNKGIVEIASNNEDSMKAAVMRIKGITATPEVGEVYTGKVVSNVAFGSFVEFLPGRQGLLHVSEIDWKRVENVDEYLKPGDMVEIKLIGIDEKTGKFKLSRKVLLPKPEREEKPKADTAG
ncbi:MAG: polyribonucleotide nucleotidyltransferase [Flavobacteriales bacterium]|nr:polyribonucleotide nucleotidyltransferase [Flavobacteriales bacterium]